jgi:hypothetical protein
MTETESIARLKEHLSATPPGPVDASEIDHLLAATWDQIEGADAGGMTSTKIIGRLESVKWEPPLLTFIVERHGGTVLGSTRAELQTWEINLETLAAALYEAGRYRRVSPTNPPMNVQPMAEEICALILEHADDKRLRWRPDGTVAVKIGEIIPAGPLPKQTLTGRRKRFRAALERMIAETGGQTIRQNVYKPPHC